MKSPQAFAGVLHPESNGGTCPGDLTLQLPPAWLSMLPGHSRGPLHAMSCHPLLGPVRVTAPLIAYVSLSIISLKIFFNIFERDTE